METNTHYTNKIKLVFIAWWVNWAVVHSMVLHGFGISFNQAITDSLVSNVLLAAACLLINNNMRYYLPRREKYIYVIVVSAALGAIWLLSMRFILWLIFQDDEAYLHMLKLSSSLRFSIAFLLIGSMAMISLAWYSEKEKSVLDSRKQEAEKLLRDSELRTLRNQLQPHFLFNALNSISALIISHPENARSMIQQLSDFLRGSLRKDDVQLNTLKEEIEYLQLYLDIEKVRFGHRLETEIIIDNEEILLMKIPNMLLQPVMENAIKFGLYDTLGQVCISLTAERNDALLIITIKNPFDPETSLPLHGTGFGLSSVRKRLALLYGRHDLLKTTAEDHIFTTIISVPQL
ncbi:MAG: histidine kinase [Chitinophagaceae bacterium]